LFDGAQSCSTVGADVFGALMGISFSAMGIAQISAAAEAFAGSRSAAYPALEAINRKFDPNDENELENVEDPPDNQKLSTMKRSEMQLPKYVIDSTSHHGKQLTSVNGEIFFNNVSFSYPTRPEQMVFNGLSLKVKAGSTVALVGPSGSGKSTTVSLLERFYDVTSGSIILDGVDIRDLNVQWLREHIGLVSQEPVLFARSIKENIAYGLPGATDEDIIRAAKSANAHDFISKFPNGYETQVGDKGTQVRARCYLDIRFKFFDPIMISHETFVFIFI
jgi:ATP-binding cassette, subfamily B (MDR/TAP), member 1